MALEAKTDPDVSLVENYRSCFKGNIGISSGITSLNSSRMVKSSMHCSLLESKSWMFTANNLQLFLTHFFACKEDIFLSKTFFGMPLNFTWFA